VDGGAPSPPDDDGTITVCFGCGLVQMVRSGIRCAIPEDDAEDLFSNPAVIAAVITVAKLRAVDPMRVSEIVRAQADRRR
jgi:hypothetical protein